MDKQEHTCKKAQPSSWHTQIPYMSTLLFIYPAFEALQGLALAYLWPHFITLTLFSGQSFSTALLPTPYTALLNS